MSLRESAENFIKEIEANLQESAVIDEKFKSLELEREAFLLKQQQLQKDQEALRIANETLGKEKEFVKMALEKTKNQELIDKKLEEKKKSLIDREFEVKKNEDRIAQEDIRLDEKLKKTKELDEKEASLKIKEDLIIKHQVANNKFKEELDIQRIGNLNEANRLKRIAEIYNAH